ncbi:MAG: tail fiber domain-containing protein [Acidobacteriota bacterium]
MRASAPFAVFRAFALCLMIPALLTSSLLASDAVSIQAGTDQVQWRALIDNAGQRLTVVGPGGFVYERTFAAGQTPSFGAFTADGAALADGSYNWQLELLPALSAETRAELEAARAAGNTLRGAELRQSGAIRSAQADGHFLLKDGAFIVPDGSAEESRQDSPAAGEGIVAERTAEGQIPGLVARDQVIADDLIVDGSACIGFDCVNGEAFSFDTVRLKENNLRIKFEDTSTGGSFPTTDWQIIANDSTNGGLNKFSVFDDDVDRTPFTIEGNGPNHSLYVDDGGRVGFGTSIPVADLHVKSGNSPTLRLEQDGSSGFGLQTWDLAGNETNFFIRDATNGSTLPFRIRPGAPGNTIYIENDGNIGIGNTAADARLHVVDNGNDPFVLIDGSGAAEATRELLLLENNGLPRLVLDNSADVGGRWFFGLNQNSNFVISLQGSPTNELRIDTNGNMFVRGAVNATAFNPVSDVNRKHAIQAVDTERVLDTLLGLPVATWAFKGEDAGVRHMGPMAQDFHAAFGLGDDDTRISTHDPDGVALAAIQGLNQRMHRQLEVKQTRIDELEARLAALEALLLAQAEADGH